MSTVTIGHRVVDITTGYVLWPEPDTVERFDLTEWVEHYGRAVPDRLDPADLGYWMRDGRFQAPSETWRHYNK